MRWLADGDEITDLVDPYARVDRTSPPGPCWVLANMVSGLDGSASIGGRVGALTSETDQRLFRSLRSLSDLVLVGAETVRREGYGPVRLTEDHRSARRREGRREVPSLAIVSRSLTFDWEAPAFRAVEPGARTIIVTCACADAARRERASEVADVIVVGDEQVDLAEALAVLAARGAAVVLCEGGPTLLGELASGGLLDELCLTVSPLLGGDPKPVAVWPPGAPLSHLRLAHTLVETDTLYLRYQRGRR